MSKAGTRSMTPAARVEVERVIPFETSRVVPFVSEPSHYPDWIEPLNRLTPKGDGEFVADVGYFGQPNEHAMRRLTGETGGLETTGRQSLIRWTVAIEPEGQEGTRARFVYEKGGSGTVFGASANSPMFSISIEVLAERSLERLERLVASETA